MTPRPSSGAEKLPEGCPWLYVLFPTSGTTPSCVVAVHDLSQPFRMLDRCEKSMRDGKRPPTYVDR